MPICIECGFKIANLYTTYSKADDRALGKGVRLTQCPRCKRFADKYVEHDYVVIFIDLILIKPQVYRHLLFNRLGREDDRFDPSIIRLGVLLLLFDVYLTWARIEKATAPLSLPNDPGLASNATGFEGNNASLTQPGHPGSSPSHASPGPTDGGIHAGAPFSTFITTQPIILQYLFFLSLCFSETAAFHLPIRWILGLFPPPRAPAPTSIVPTTTPLSTGTASTAASPETKQQPFDAGALSRTTSKHSTALSPQPSPVGSVSDSDSQLSPHSTAGRSQDQGPSASPQPRWFSKPLIPYYPHPSVISTALLVSSFTKLFPLLLLIWSYDLPSSASAVSWAVIVNNVAALDILLDCGLPRAVLLAAFGAVCRGLVGWGVLRAVGVEGGVAAAGVVETGDLVDLWRRGANWLAGVG